MNILYKYDSKVYVTQMDCFTDKENVEDAELFAAKKSQFPSSTRKKVLKMNEYLDEKTFMKIKVVPYLKKKGRRVS